MNKKINRLTTLARSCLMFQIMFRQIRSCRSPVPNHARPITSGSRSQQLCRRFRLQQSLWQTICLSTLAGQVVRMRTIRLYERVLALYWGSCCHVFCQKSGDTCRCQRMQLLVQQRESAKCVPAADIWLGNRFSALSVTFVPRFHSHSRWPVIVKVLSDLSLRRPSTLFTMKIYLPSPTTPKQYFAWLAEPLSYQIVVDNS